MDGLEGFNGVSVFVSVFESLAELGGVFEARAFNGKGGGIDFL
jgi:hypothetical protein